jgi:hypothetical protein
VKLFQMIPKVVQSEIDLIPVPAMVIVTVESYRGPFGALMDRVFVTFEIVWRGKSGDLSLASLLLAFEWLRVLCLMLA